MRCGGPNVLEMSISENWETDTKPIPTKILVEYQKPNRHHSTRKIPNLTDSCKYYFRPPKNVSYQ